MEYRCAVSNSVQWILAHNARVVRVSSQYDEEETRSRFRCAEKRLPCNISMHDNINGHVKLMHVKSLGRRGV
jgi:hypothetical protein